MIYYQEITLVSQIDVNAYHIYSDVYEKIHHSFCNKGNGTQINIGLSFPEYRYSEKADKGSLGSKIRLFAMSKHELDDFDIRDLLEGYADYVHISSIQEVAGKATHYEVYSRYRHVNSYERAVRLQAHFLKKHGEDKYNEAFGSFEAVLEHCEQTDQSKNMPWITLVSDSNKQRYPIVFKRTILQKPTTDFIFNDFGLSANKTISTVPGW